MKESDIYICHTYYHVLISLIKEIAFNRRPYIVICDNIPEYEKLKENLLTCGIFENVFEFSENKCKEDSNHYKIEGKKDILFINSNFKKFIKPSFELRKSTYQEVYIFNDYSYLGYYLRANKIYYTLFEDAKDSYKVLENYVKIDYGKSLKHRIFGFVFETLYFHGKSKYSKVVEVNDAHGIKIPKEKIRVKNKQEMLNILTDEQKRKIYEVFMGEKDNAIQANDASILILTQPLFEDKMVKSKDIQRKIYQDIIGAYCKGVVTVIKPHPRDNFNYVEEFNKVSVIDKNLPTEILNFNPKMKFKKAITVTSSSIHGIDFVEDKIYLGFDWLKQYQ